MPANDPNPPLARWDGNGESLWELARGRVLGLVKGLRYNMVALE